MRAHISFRCVLFSLCLIAGNARAQAPPTIELNAVSRQAVGTIPFDRPFILKIEHPEEPAFVDYLMDRKQRCWECMLARQLNGKKIVTLGTLPKDRVTFKKEGDKTFLYLRFDYRPYEEDPACKENDLVRPSRNLSVLIPSYDPRGFDILGLVHQKKQKEALEALDVLTEEHLTKYGATYLLPHDGDLASMYDSVKTQYVQIDSLRKLLRPHLERTYAIPDSGCLDRLIRHVQLDSAAGRTICPVDCELMKQMLALRALSDTELGRLVAGKRTVLDSNLKKMAEPDTLVALKATEEQLRAMLNLSARMELATGVPCSDKALAELHTAVVRSISLLEAIARQKAAIKKNIMGGTGSKFVTVSSLEASSTVYAFKTRSPFRLIPDFGFIYYGFEKGFNGALPYLGVELNFRMLDKDIPFSQYPNRRPGHYFSASLGWTLNNDITKEGKRKDLFTKGSLMTGVGIRLNNSLRINSGLLWFYREDPNPVIDHRTLAYTPYVGLSFDLDLKQLLNGLDALIPIVP